MLEQKFSVLPRNYEQLPEDEKEYFDKLNTFEAPYLEEKLLAEEEIKTSEEYKEAFNEFKKYVALLAISGEQLGMLGKKVDTVWHQFILFTREYHEFCNKFFGKYIHHTPKTSFTKVSPQADKNFEEWYHKLYGCLPVVWRE